MEKNGWITLIGCVVQGPEGGPIDESSELWKEIRQDLLRLKWYDHRTLELGYEHPEIGLRKAETHHCPSGSFVSNPCKEKSLRI